jgi:hypothetical protein
VFMHQTQSSVIFNVCTSNKAAVIPMEDSVIYMSKNGKAGQIKLREHVYCFLWQQANASHSVYSSMPNCESTVLRRVRKTLEKDVRRRITDKWYTQDRLLSHDIVLAHILSSVQHTWTKNNMVVVSHPSACLTYLLMPFLFSQIWKSSGKEKDLRVLWRYTLNRRQC